MPAHKYRNNQRRWLELQKGRDRSKCDIRVAFCLVVVGLLCLQLLMFQQTSAHSSFNPAGSHHHHSGDNAQREAKPSPVVNVTPPPPPPQRLRHTRAETIQPVPVVTQHQQQEEPHQVMTHVPVEPPEDTAEPNLVELMDRIQKGLSQYQRVYLNELARKSGKATLKCNLGYQSPVQDSYLVGCPDSGCQTFSTREEAEEECDRVVDCGGIVVDTGASTFELRSGHKPRHSPNGESSIPKIMCFRDATSTGIWDTFYKIVEDGLNDPSLHLGRSFGPPRTDDSIYLSIASYRDPTCRATLKQAFERASHPEKLFVGIVQQNCEESCMTGTGWGNTRRWVPGDPDPDCAEEFCMSAFGKRFCDNDQVRILRLPEVASLGPFFTRFLNSKMWRGETYYMQIDAHTEFRSAWDTSLVEQMKATPSFPYSVISNYPPSGSPEIRREWAASDGRKSYAPSALCGCMFEGVGKRKTIRLSQSSRRFGINVDKNIPHRSLFVAAGFFIAHGSIVDRVPFDPFMPYLFMGEEIALSVRFWTSGYDIYGPSEDVLKHEYVRKEHPKFWETVTMVYSNPGVHNALTDVIIQRVQHLVGFPEAKDKSQVSPVSVLDRVDEFWLGKVRPIDQYLEIANLDLHAKTQHAPKFCTSGEDPPYVSTREMVEASDAQYRG